MRIFFVAFSVAILSIADFSRTHAQCDVTALGDTICDVDGGNTAQQGGVLGEIPWHLETEAPPDGIPKANLEGAIAIAENTDDLSAAFEQMTLQELEAAYIILERTSADELQAFEGPLLTVVDGRKHFLGQALVPNDLDTSSSAGLCSGGAGLEDSPQPLSPVTGQSILVSSLAAFNAAMRQAGPGDEIIIKNGSYDSWGDFHITSSGTADSPVIIRAESPLGVIFTGKVSLYIKASHVEIAGFQFKDTYGWAIVGLPKRGDVRISGNSFQNVGIGGGDEVFRIFGSATNYEIDNNDISNANFIAMILYAPKPGDATFGGQQNHVVHHNYFHDMKKLGRNGGEAIATIGGQGDGSENVGNTIENNRFENWNGEIELISVKASGYTLRNNFVQDSYGNITLRHTNNSSVLGNITVDSGGILVNGTGHRISGNETYGTGGGLILIGQVDVDVAGTGREAANSNLIEDNIFTSTEMPPLKILYRSCNIVDSVENNRLKGNIFYNAGGGSYIDPTGCTTVDDFFINGNTMTNNTLFSSGGPLTPPPGSGNVNEDPRIDLTPPGDVNGSCGDGT